MNRDELHHLTTRRSFELLSNCDNLTTKELSSKLKMHKTDLRKKMNALIEMGVATKTKYQSHTWYGKVNLYNITEKGKKYLKSINSIIGDTNV